MEYVNEKYRNYLEDLGKEILDLAWQAKAKRDGSISGQERHYNDGYLMAFHRVISLMQQQTIGFSISLEELHLNEIDPDSDLI